MQVYKFGEILPNETCSQSYVAVGMEGKQEGVDVW